jgi:GntR family transcriptional regulator
MLLQIDHHSGVPIYRQLVEQVRQQAMTGALDGGEQVPSVRDLAAQLNINPMTISKAYALLENAGILERRRGVGLFVAPVTGARREHLAAELVGELLERAAVAAVQLGITEEGAVELFRKQYSKYREKKGSEV